MASDLPPFLHGRFPGPSGRSVYRNAVFQHNHPLGPAHAIWWPAKQAKSPPDTVLFFIPGNPGLLDFYIPFLTAIHDKDTTTRLAILGHSHLGHTPDIPNNKSQYSLIFQVQSALEAFDAIKTTFGITTKIILVGHSVGAWISLQIIKARPGYVSDIFLLFPTISHIARTPNGRRLSWLFSNPARTILTLLSCMIRRIPTRVLSILFHEWPFPQILVLQSFLQSPENIAASLRMAHDEMIAIGDLDSNVLQEQKHHFKFYFAEKDDWVGDQKDSLVHFCEVHDISARIVHGSTDIPHAFCINHGEQLAEQCHQWLNA